MFNQINYLSVSSSHVCKCQVNKIRDEDNRRLRILDEQLTMSIMKIVLMLLLFCCVLFFILILFAFLDNCN